MKTQNKDLVKDQTATCDNAVLPAGVLVLHLFSVIFVMGFAVLIGCGWMV
jgi:hypothetical protein